MNVCGGRKSGTVVWFNDTKGYGFIKPTDGVDQIFVHRSEIKGPGYTTLIDGENVEYETEKGSDGSIRAKNVTLDAPDGRRSGTVVWFRDDRGFGYIKPAIGSKNIYVQQSDIEGDGFKTLIAGESVKYEFLKESDGRIRATKVTRGGGDDGDGPGDDGDGRGDGSDGPGDGSDGRGDGGGGDGGNSSEEDGSYEGKCFRCDSRGQARDCERNEGHGGGGIGCKWCGDDTGHVGRDCRTCNWCDRVGHILRNCPYRQP